jgi:membrane-bound metal-dependent hydrolase YbcI (DUF457 family)
MNGKFHRIVGTAAGSAVAGYRYRTLPAAIAGGVGGHIGAALPDWLEPAITPNHRGIAHSWTAAGVIASGAPAWILRIERYAAEQVRYHEAEAERNAESAQWHRFLALLWSFAGAFVLGLLSGFGSHLVCDALTPQSLPFLINGW